MENGREETQEHHNPVTVVDGRDIAELVKKEAAFSRYVDHKFQELDRDGNGKLSVELELVVSLSSRSVFSLSSRWFLSLSFCISLHRVLSFSLLSLSFPTEASPSQTPSRPSPSLFWLALGPARHTPSQPPQAALVQPLEAVVVEIKSCLLP